MKTPLNFNAGQISIANQVLGPLLEHRREAIVTQIINEYRSEQGITDRKLRDLACELSNTASMQSKLTEQVNKMNKKPTEN